MIWHGDNVSPYNITVEPDLTEIQKQLRATFPSEQIEVSSSKDALLLTGVVSDAEIAKQPGSLAAVQAKSVVNLIQSPLPNNRRWMLHVTFVTLDRAITVQFAIDFFVVITGLV